MGHSSRESDAETLARLAIHRQPSAISAPVIESLEGRVPKAEAWLRDWELSERKRAILAGHPGADGIVFSDGEPVLVDGDQC